MYKFTVKPTICFTTLIIVTKRNRKNKYVLITRVLAAITLKNFLITLYYKFC